MPDEPDLSSAIADRFAGWPTADDGTDAAALDLFVRLASRDARASAVPDDATLAAIRAALTAGFQAPALAALREWSRRDAPDEAALLLCAVLLRHGDPEAGRLLQRCLARVKDPASGWSEVGDALLDHGKKGAALVCFAKAPPSAPLALRSGLVARDLGRRDEAVAWFAQAARLDPEAERGWFLLGTAAQDVRRFDHAVAAYRVVLRLNPGRVEAEVNLGMCLQASGRLDLARESYGRAVRARPDTFGRVAQALPGSPTGELWLDLRALRRSFTG